MLPHTWCGPLGRQRRKKARLAEDAEKEEEDKDISDDDFETGTDEDEQEAGHGNLVREDDCADFGLKPDLNKLIMA